MTKLIYQTDYFLPKLGLSVSCPALIIDFLNKHITFPFIIEYNLLNQIGIHNINNLIQQRDYTQSIIGLITLQINLYDFNNKKIDINNKNIDILINKNNIQLFKLLLRKCNHFSNMEYDIINLFNDDNDDNDTFYFKNKILQSLNTNY